MGRLPLTGADDEGVHARSYDHRSQMARGIRILLFQVLRSH